MDIIDSNSFQTIYTIYNNSENKVLMNDENGINRNRSKFPTMGLRTLLQNSDLLDLLIEPLKESESSFSSAFLSQSYIPLLKIKDTCDKDIDSSKKNNHASDSICEQEQHHKEENFTDLIKNYCDEELKIKDNPNCDLDFTNSSSNVYGNAFLGQNLWDKNDLFKSEKLGVKFECLDFDEFLNENNLNESDILFIDNLQPKSVQNKIIPDYSNCCDTDLFENKKSMESKSAIVNNLEKPKSVEVLNNIDLKQSSIENETSNHSSSSLYSSKLNINQTDLSNKTAKFQEKNFSNESYKFNINSKVMETYPDNYDRNVTSILFDSSEKNQLNFNLFSTNTKTQKFNDQQELLEQLHPSYMLDYDENGNFEDEGNDENDGELDANGKRKHQFVPNELKDDRYWARRKKNNLAAKRSRDARRLKENQIAIRATFLEKENDNLRKQLDQYKQETKILKLKLARYEASENLNANFQEKQN